MSAISAAAPPQTPEAAPRLARWRLAAFLGLVLLPVFQGALQLLLHALLSRQACPSSAIACWSIGQASYIVGAAASIALAAVGGVWVLASRFAKLHLVVTSAAACLLVVATGWLSYADAQHYVAIARDGLLVRPGGDAPATLHKWRDLTGVLARCESGSRSGPRVNVYFRSSSGQQIAVSYNTWRSVTAQVPSIAAETNQLPYRTQNMDWCAKRSTYDRLPLQRLN